MDVFLATLSPMLVMFVCLLIGFVLRKKQLLPDNAGTVLSRLETHILGPSLTINTFRRYCTVQSLREQSVYTLTALCVLAVAMIIGIFLGRVFSNDGYRRKIYQYALVFANYGFMGNAIVPAIMGEEMLYPYMLFTLPLNVCVYTWGVSSLIPRGEKRKRWWQQLINPMFGGLCIGAFLGLSGLNAHMPSFLSGTLNYLAACMAPIAMVLTGFVVGGYALRSLLTNRKIYIVTLLRLVVIPLVFLSVLYALGADRLTLLFTVFAFATPMGLNTVVFPAAYGGDTTTGASMAMISHTFCIVTIPLLYTAITMLV